MYKVFFNDHILCFCGENEISLKSNNAQIIEIESFDDFESCFPDNDFMHCVNNLLIVCSKPADLWREFRQSLVQVSAAGGLVTNRHSEILFIKRLGKWDLPKGKIEKGERVEVAAVREVEEECGLSGPTIVKQLPSTFHLYHSPFIKKGNNLVLKETCWFEMNYAGNETPVPQIAEDIEDVKWFKKTDLQEVLNLTYKNLEELLKIYLA